MLGMAQPTSRPVTIRATIALMHTRYLRAGVVYSSAMTVSPTVPAGRSHQTITLCRSRSGRRIS
jgi:hypothetical protein